MLDAQEIVAGEIWQITVSTGESFYVLEATCEVIGHPPGCDGAVPAMRADWMDYAAEQGNGRPLLKRMRWAHNEEYERGLSRHWISRTRTMSGLGEALRTVGERYTLACVASNRWVHRPSTPYSRRPAYCRQQRQRRMDVHCRDGARVGWACPVSAND